MCKILHFVAIVSSMHCFPWWAIRFQPPTLGSTPSWWFGSSPHYIPPPRCMHRPIGANDCLMSHWALSLHFIFPRIITLLSKKKFVMWGQLWFLNLTLQLCNFGLYLSKQSYTKPNMSEHILSTEHLYAIGINTIFSCFVFYSPFEPHVTKSHTSKLDGKPLTFATLMCFLSFGLNSYIWDVCFWVEECLTRTPTCCESNDHWFGS